MSVDHQGQRFFLTRFVLQVVGDNRNSHLQHHAFAAAAVYRVVGRSHDRFSNLFVDTLNFTLGGAAKTVAEGQDVAQKVGWGAARGRRSGFAGIQLGLEARFHGEPFGIDDAVISGVADASTRSDHVVSKDTFLFCPDAQDCGARFFVKRIGL